MWTDASVQEGTTLLHWLFERLRNFFLKKAIFCGIIVIHLLFYSTKFVFLVYTFIFIYPPDIYIYIQLLYISTHISISTHLLLSIIFPYLPVNLLICIYTSFFYYFPIYPVNLLENLKWISKKYSHWHDRYPWLDEYVPALLTHDGCLYKCWTGFVLAWRVWFGRVLYWGFWRMSKRCICSKHKSMSRKRRLLQLWSVFNSRASVPRSFRELHEAR